MRILEPRRTLVLEPTSHSEAEPDFFRSRDVAANEQPIHVSESLPKLPRILTAARRRIGRLLHHRVVAAPEQERLLVLAAFGTHLRDLRFHFRIAIRRNLA